MSSAILMYLSSKYQVADHWYPADLQARARVHEYLGWHTDNIRGIFGVPLWTKVLGPLIGTQIPEEKVERNLKNMFESLQRLEENGRVTKGRTLLATYVSQKHCDLGKARITEQTLSDLFPAWVGGSFWLLSGLGMDYTALDLPWGCVHHAWAESPAMGSH
ncbi:glutathione S-transferase theta-2-like isoform X1 [Arvicola amphibius]|uniref:glutathione S-transferase theta-2-like isoform X1 n=1 Tax=Arvicola amphibius TaxID=1047088 RepID=UPI0018E2FFBA|nr:glutathione S-transferase theta-2-like isoform X1 [Arvicola amphibius]